MTKEYRPETVLLKFQFTNRGLVPPSARRVARDEYALVERRIERGIMAGEHSEADQVTVKPFVKQLFSFGYKPSDLHFYTKVGNGTDKNLRYILIMSFTRNGDMIRLTDKDLKILGQLIDHDAWSHFHLFHNPNGIMCVHCLHRVPDEAKGPDVGEFFLEPPTGESGYDYEYQPV